MLQALALTYKVVLFKHLTGGDPIRTSNDKISGVHVPSTIRKIWEAAAAPRQLPPGEL